MPDMPQSKASGPVEWIVCPTNLGVLYLAVNEQGLQRLTWGVRQRVVCHRARRQRPPWLARLCRLLQRYARGERVSFDDIPVDVSGLPAFARRVLEAARQIAYGEVTTYGALARRVGQPGAARAVGQALAHNPVPIVIPCHRVVRADGTLGGFSAARGITKRRLLALEQGQRSEARGSYCQ